MNRLDLNGHETGRQHRTEGFRVSRPPQPLGATWWSKQFMVSVLESFSPLSKGLSYARGGRVTELDISPGLVHAQVQGSRTAPYMVEVRIPVFQEAEWEAAEAAISRRAACLDSLLAGEMPGEIELVFRSANLSLFPAGIHEFETTCNCPDLANPCRHVAATYYVLSDTFAKDPFLLFRWRGRERDQLQERLARLREAEEMQAPPMADPVPAQPPVDPGFSRTQQDFYEQAREHCRLEVERMNGTIRTEWQVLYDKVQRVQELIQTLEYRKQVAGQIYSAASDLLGLENDLDVTPAIKET